MSKSINLSKLHYAILTIISFSTFNLQAATAPVVADTYVDSNSTRKSKNFGSVISLNVNATKKSLLGFSLSTLPADITEHDISKATLFLYVKTMSTPGKLQVKQLNNSWFESTITNNDAPLALEASKIVSANIIQKEVYFAVDITAIVKSWVANPNINYGLSLEPDTTGLVASVTFDSKEATLTSHPAYIDIMFNRAEKGDKGEQGIQGEKGDVGPKGDIGSQGLQGAIGPKGDTGLTGATGPQGSKGDMGELVGSRYRIVSDTTTSWRWTSSTVSCDSDEVVTGGGGTCTGGGGFNFIYASQPVNNGWQIMCDTPSQQNNTASVYAICIKK